MSLDSITPLMAIFRRRFFPALLVCLLTLSGSGAGAAAEPVKMAVLGDSLSAGYRLRPGEAFPEKLAAALGARGYSITMVNAAVSGDTTAQGLARLDWSIAPGTDLVIVELGANDALRGLPPAAARRNLAAIIDGLRRRGIGVVLAGMLAPPNLGAEYGKAFNSIYPDLAREKKIPLYRFFLEGVAADPAFNQPDGLHPTARGVDEIVRRFMPFIEPIIRALPDRS